jgi:membrane protein YqaA with SNARE-associated domain
MPFRADSVFFDMDYLAWGWLGLFAVCFLSATILPLTSEGILILFLIAGYSPWACLLVASVANVLGGLTNYALGRVWNPEKLRRKLGSSQRFDRLQGLAQRYGFWLGLISWLPLLGDPLLIVLGYLRTPLLPLILTMSAAKTARYALFILFWAEW